MEFHIYRKAGFKMVLAIKCVLGATWLIPIANCEDGKYRPIKRQGLGSQKLPKKTLFQSSYKIVLLISELC